ncbi:hypothetical protein SprV_0301162000 [Sparganum proliferum]
MRSQLYTTFVSFKKAFETENLEGLWQIMQKFGYPERFTHMLRQPHDGMMTRVKHNGAISEAFAVTSGVKQGCVLAPTLFSLTLPAMLMEAYRDDHPGIHLAYRTNGHLLNSRCMKAITQLTTTTVGDLFFTDDRALNTMTEVDIQRSMYLLTAGSASFGLTINTDKTVVMHQPPLNMQHC